MKTSTAVFLSVLSGMAIAAETGKRAHPTETPYPQYPAQAYSQGHQGKTLLSLQILSDGNVGAVEIKESSRSPILDEAAVESVKKWKFSPAMDSEGNALASRVIVPIEFSKDSSRTVMKKSCGDLNVDVQFFKNVFPESPLSNMRISKLTLGMVVLAEKSLDKKVALGKGFSRVFESVVQKCEANPGNIYGDVLVSVIKESNL